VWRDTHAREHACTTKVNQACEFANSTHGPQPAAAPNNMHSCPPAVLLPPFAAILMLPAQRRGNTVFHLCSPLGTCAAAMALLLLEAPLGSPDLSLSALQWKRRCREIQQS